MIESSVLIFLTSHFVAALSFVNTSESHSKKCLDFSIVLLKGNFKVFQQYLNGIFTPPLPLISLSVIFTSIISLISLKRNT